jgi:excisionase family DNA binding protein
MDSEEYMLWSIKETARRLGNVSTRTVRRLLERGELPTMRIGRLIRIPPEGVRAWLDRNIHQAHNLS